MENEERQKLVVELYKKMQFAKFQAETQDIQDKKQKESVYVHNSELKINPKYLSNKQYFQIAQFYVFLKENPDLTDEEIREILNCNNKFSFIRKLDSKIPDLFSELKLHGPMTIATDYASKQHFHEQITKKLP